MFLTKRPSGFYYVVYVVNGRRHYVSTRCKLKSQANAFYKAFKVEQVKEKENGIRLSDLIPKYVEYSRTYHSPKTFQNIHVPLRSLLQIVTDKHVIEITSVDIDNFIKTKLSEGAKLISVHSYLGTLRGLFTRAVKWGFIEKSPMTGIKVKVPETIPAYFSKDEFNAMLNTVTDLNIKQLFIFALFSGMRLGEILQLKWRDVDLFRKVILVNNSESFRTKSGKIRIIPMNDELYRLLSQRKENSGGIDYVFYKDGKFYTRDYVSKSLKKHIVLAGINSRLHFHSLRHTFASWLVQQGTSLYEVQKLLGHQDIKTSMIYAHLQPETLHSTVNKLTL